MESLYRYAFFGCILLGVSCLFVGCSKVEHPTKPGVYVNTNRVVRIANLGDCDPVLYVNGEKITKRDFNAHLVLRDRIWRLMAKESFDVSEEEMADYQGKVGQAYLLELIHHAMFRQYAKEQGIAPSKEQVDEAAKKVLKSLGRETSTMDHVAHEIGGDAGELFLKIPYINAQDALLRQSVTTADLNGVSDEELKSREEGVAKFNATADRLNAAAAGRLKAAKARILAGANFAEEAKGIAEAVNPQFGEKWGTFILDEFPADEDLRKWLAAAKVGDISEPLDLDDGLAIVKLLAKGKGDAPPGVEPPDSYTLARCTVQAYERMRDQSPGQMRSQLLMWKREDAQKKLGTMLTERAVIEYPNGTNLFDTATADAKKGGE